MADERLAFAYEVVPLATEQIGDRRERLLRAAESAANHVVPAMGHEVEKMRPFLALETGGEMTAVYWQVLDGIDGNEFMDMVVPATLDSLDPDGAALVRFAEVITDDVAHPGIVVYAIDRSAPEQPGITLAASLVEQDGAALRPGAFKVLAHGLDPSIARALRRTAG